MQVWRTILSPALCVAMLAAPWVCCCRISAPVSAFQRLLKSPTSSTSSPNCPFCRQSEEIDDCDVSPEKASSKNSRTPTSPCPCRRESQSQSAASPAEANSLIGLSLPNQLGEALIGDAGFPARNLGSPLRRHRFESLNFPFAASGRDILRALHILTC